MGTASDLHRIEKSLAKSGDRMSRSRPTSNLPSVHPTLDHLRLVHPSFTVTESSPGLLESPEVPRHPLVTGTDILEPEDVLGHGDMIAKLVKG